MKKILALILAVAFIVLSAACGNAGTGTTDTSGTTEATPGTTAGNQTTDTGALTPEPDDGFDEDNIVLSFGALSDVHINSGNPTDSKNKFTSALSRLRKNASKDDKDGLDAILIAGDIADTGNKSEISLFKEYYESVSHTNEEELIFTLGNHERTLTLADYKEVFGDSYFTSDVDSSDFGNNSRHCVVNGYHFILLSPSTYSGGVKYAQATLDWLDDTLATITENEPNAYVFIFTHPMIYDTAYGSTLENTDGSISPWYTKALTSTLSKYPQVVTFGGHLHFPLNDERSIMQSSFTSLGCGSVRYLAIESGFGNMSGTVPPNAYNVSSGLLVQVDANGNVRITRMDFSSGGTFKEPWVINTPSADGSHLTKYTEERGSSANNKAPTMSKTVSVDVTDNGGSSSVKINFNAGKDDDFVHHYRLTVKNKATGATVSETLWLSDFYLRNSTNEMTSTYKGISLGTFAGGITYVAEVRAVDSWGAESAPSSTEFTTAEYVEENLSPELPAPYTELVFENGTVSDTNGKFTATLKDATVGKTALTFNGKEKSVDALTVSAANQCAILKFNDYDSSAITNFYNSATGFSIEGLYINRAPSGSQGIICGTENGGLGVASNAGAPYLFVYVDGGSSINLKASAASSKTELTHIVATVIYKAAENKTYATLYINGTVAGRLTGAGKVKISADTGAANAFCLGSDISKGGGGSDFMMTDFSVTNVKIYSEALNSKQVETAYNNAKALFE